MVTIQDFSGYDPTWCPGCGNHGISMAVKTALIQLHFNPSSVCFVFGIGCSGNNNDFLNTYGLHSLHGRSIPNAIGIKLANHNMKVIADVGDGDCYGEGGNHFVHACRGNHDITVIVHDNSVYGLTTGQAAPTAQKGYISKSTPSGIIEEPINPIILAISQGATFVAQTFAGNMNNMITVIKAGIMHKGFSLINILQPCVTFNKINTFKYYTEHTYNLSPEYVPENKEKAIENALEINSFKFPIGIIYRVQKPTYTDQLLQLSDNKTLVEKNNSDYSVLLNDFS